MAPEAAGWDWTGINLADGGALMAFRMRDKRGRRAVGRRHAARRRRPRAHVRAGRGPLRAARTWRSPRTGVDYPVAMTVDAGGVALRARAAHGRPGARFAREHRHDLLGRARCARCAAGREAGRGYLELTGYGAPLRL